MKPHRTLLITLAVALYAVAILGVAGLLEAFMIKSFDTLENDSVATNVRRALGAINASALRMAGSCGDWALWDESYQFVADGNAEFLQHNATDQPYRELRLDLMLFRRLDGSVTFCKMFDLDADKEIPVDSRVVSALLSHEHLFALSDTTRRPYGFVPTERGLMMVATCPILKSDGSGPPRGTLFFGRFLDAEEIRRIASTVNLEVELLPADQRVHPAHIDSSANTIHSIEAVSGDQIRGVALLTDLDGNVIAMLQTKEPRGIHAQGRHAALYFLLAAAILFLAGIATSAYMIDRLILSAAAGRRSERLRGHIVETSSDGLLVARAPSGEIIETNPAAVRILGMAAALLRVRRLHDAVQMSEERWLRAVKKLEVKEREDFGEMDYARPDGARAVIDVEVALMSLGDETVYSMHIRDVTEAARVRERERFVMYYDPLTSLPNRTLFMERLNSEIERARSEERRLAVLCLDIDHFKEVNEQFGHEEGDRFLKEATRRLRESLRPVDFPARQSADIFLAIVTDLESGEDAVVHGERILESMRRPFHVGDRDVMMTSSLGIAIFPNDGESAATLLQKADIAMSQVKDRGRDGWCIFDPELQRRASTIIDMRTRLNLAIERNEFTLYYQPQFEVRSGKVRCVEALIRWNSPQGLVMPGQFITAAEETGLIVTIGRWVLQEACRRMAAWRRDGFGDLAVAVNLSPRQFSEDGFEQTVRAALDESGLDPRALELEITEGLAVRNPEETCTLLERLRTLGVSTALDDFGTGYSSLSHLRRFPFDRLKLDRSFLDAGASGRNTEPVVASVISLAHALGMKVVAEGVETSEQLGILIRNGCDIVQGFGFCRPMPAAECEKFLRDAAARPTASADRYFNLRT